MTETLQNAVRFAQTGPINTVLTIESIPKPVNPPGYSLVQVHASAINPSDVLNVEGRFPMTSAPRTPGRDFAGIVVDGPQESIGRRVWGTGGTNGFDRDGSHAEWIVVPSDSLEEMPDNISFAQAAACGVAFLTASMMLNRAATKKGEYVLVLGQLPYCYVGTEFEIDCPDFHRFIWSCRLCSCTARSLCRRSSGFYIPHKRPIVSEHHGRLGTSDRKDDFWKRSQCYYRYGWGSHAVQEVH